MAQSRHSEGQDRHDSLEITHSAGDVESVPVARAPDGKWLAGRSANPGGRVRASADSKQAMREATELARQASPQAVRRLIGLMEHQDPNVALKAAEAVLDRGLGKARQTVGLEWDAEEHDERRKTLHTLVGELAERIAEAERAAAEREPDVLKLPRVTGALPEPVTLDVEPEQRALEPARSHILDGATERPTPPWRDPE